MARRGAGVWLAVGILVWCTGSPAWTGRAEAETSPPTCAQGDALAEAGLWTKALAAYEGAIAAGTRCDLAAVQQARSNVGDVARLVHEAAVLRRDGKVDRAVARLEQAMAADPSATEPPDALAEIEDARADLSRIRQLDATGYSVEAAAKLKQFAIDHPDAPIPAHLRDLTRETRWAHLVDVVRGLLPALVLLAAIGTLGFLYCRSARARRRSDRLVLGGFTREESSGGGGPSGSDPKAGGAASVGTGVATSPVHIESALIRQLSDLREEGPSGTLRLVTGPDEAIDLPTPDTLPSQLKVVSVLSLLLPHARYYSLKGSVVDEPTVSRLSLRMLQGEPESGSVVAAVTVSSSAPTSADRQAELAARAAAWVTFTWSQVQGRGPDFEVAGTRSWSSYGSFLTGLYWHQRPPAPPARPVAPVPPSPAPTPQQIVPRALAQKEYSLAIRSDAGNRNALINLALLLSTTDGALSRRLALRAIHLLGDDHPESRELPDPRRCAFVWRPNWYRANANLVAGMVNDWTRAHAEVDPAGRRQLAAAANAARRMHATAREVAQLVRRDDNLLPAGVEGRSEALAGFLRTSMVTFSLLEAAVEVERGESERARTLLTGIQAPLNPFHSANAAEVWSRLRAVDETLACLREAKLMPVDLRTDAQYAWLRDGHAEKWATVFPSAS